jgi:hypothetical protein
MVGTPGAPSRPSESASRDPPRGDPATCAEAIPDSGAPQCRVGKSRIGACFESGLEMHYDLERRFRAPHWRLRGRETRYLPPLGQRQGALGPAGLRQESPLGVDAATFSSIRVGGLSTAAPTCLAVSQDPLPSAVLLHIHVSSISSPTRTRATSPPNAPQRPIRRRVLFPALNPPLNLNRSTAPSSSSSSPGTSAPQSSRPPRPDIQAVAAATTASSAFSP